jgi:arylformamidase
VSSQWVDVSVPLKSGMLTWPDDPPVRISRVLDLERGDPCTVSLLEFGAHTGTHLDAPLHFLRGGASIDSMPIAATVGPARVVAVSDPVSVKVADLEPHLPAANERLLLKTRNSDRRWADEPFDEGFVYLSHEAALFLAERGVRTVGVDYLSVGGFLEDQEETHRALLEAGIWVIEGLDLSAVPPGDYELICLPLRIVGAEGAPARALLRPLAAGAGRRAGL